jgi:23S rRNA pseudouridine1911/1915/1917 synthase
MIIYEDNHLLILNKPFCMPSQGDDTGDLNAFDWAQNYLRTTYKKEGNVYTGLLHRLDRPTGGILMLAKTSKAAARLSEDFQKNRIQKTYHAITEKIPAEIEGDLEHYLAKMADKNITKAYQKAVPGAKIAQLHYKVLKTQGERALIKVEPKTGRQHQIRVQLASMGCVICGDAKYGRTDFLPNKSIALLAKEIEFIHPTKKEKMHISIEMPDSTPWNLFK